MRIKKAKSLGRFRKCNAFAKVMVNFS